MAVNKGLRRIGRPWCPVPGAAHAGHQSGMPDSIPLQQRNRPPSQRNTVRHHSGMLSAISPESCPSWRGTRNIGRAGLQRLPKSLRQALRRAEHSIDGRPRTLRRASCRTANRKEANPIRLKAAPVVGRFQIQHGEKVFASQHYPSLTTTLPVIGLILDCSEPETDNSPPFTLALLSPVAPLRRGCYLGLLPGENPFRWHQVWITVQS
jgi:hypothetical protein